MAVVYRAKFLEGLKLLMSKGEVTLPNNADPKTLFDLLYQKNWVIYAKAPFAGPQTVIEYLARYTHKVAISNHRICSINEQDDTVTFDYKDYADEGKQKQMTLSCAEFIRRFEQHILPPHFTKIRTYGYLANRDRHIRINQALRAMNLPPHQGLIKIPLQVRMKEAFGVDINECPCCKNKSLKLIKVFYPWKKGDDG